MQLEILCSYLYQQIFDGHRLFPIGLAILDWIDMCRESLNTCVEVRPGSSVPLHLIDVTLHKLVVCSVGFVDFEAADLSSKEFSM